MSAGSTVTVEPVRALGAGRVARTRTPCAVALVERRPCPATIGLLGTVLHDDRDRAGRLAAVREDRHRRTRSPAPADDRAAAAVRVPRRGRRSRARRRSCRSGCTMSSVSSFGPTDSAPKSSPSAVPARMFVNAQPVGFSRPLRPRVGGAAACRSGRPSKLTMPVARACTAGEVTDAGHPAARLRVCDDDRLLLAPALPQSATSLFATRCRPRSWKSCSVQSPIAGSSPTIARHL